MCIPSCHEENQTLEKADESNFFHSFKVVLMKLDTHGPYISIIEKGCVSNLFHNFQVIPMRLATSYHHEEQILFVRFETEVPKLCLFYEILICT